MLARDIISNEISPLRTSDTGEEGITIMGVFSVRHLPVVDDKILQGVIGEDDIYSSDLDKEIGTYDAPLNRSFVTDDDHIFEVMSKMAEHKLSVMPVIDKEGKYLGVISQDKLVQYYASSISFSDPGCVIVLDIHKHNYLLSEICHIIEQEGATILGTFLTPVENTDRLYVNIKLNQVNIQPIVASLQRHDYYVKGSFYEDEYFDNLKEHYDGLMKYLNI